MFLAGNLLLSERSYLVGRNTVTGPSEPISVTEGRPINLSFNPLHITIIKRRKKTSQENNMYSFNFNHAYIVENTPLFCLVLERLTYSNSQIKTVLFFRSCYNISSADLYLNKHFISMHLQNLITIARNSQIFLCFF